MSEVVQENVQENVQEKVVEVVPEKVEENVKEMTKKKEEPAPPTITNPEPVQDAPKVNKKLSTMSKNTKEKQKNRKLSKPTTSRAPSQGFSLDINPMYLFGLLGVIIAGASLWYQRKSFLKEQEEEQTPVQSTGGESEEKKQSSPPKKPKKDFDPWEWKREHQQTGMFPGNYDFD